MCSGGQDGADDTATAVEDLAEQLPIAERSSGRTSPSSAVIGVIGEGGFHRAEVPLVVVVVGDGVDEAVAEELPAEGFEAWFRAESPSGSWVQVGDAPVDAAAADRATALGGVVVAPSELVTAGPWIAGYRLVNRLSGTPDPATLEVELVRQDHDPRLLDAGFWTWDAASNAVVLSSVWPTGSLVVASYVPMTP